VLVSEVEDRKVRGCMYSAETFFTDKLVAQQSKERKNTVFEGRKRGKFVFAAKVLYGTYLLAVFVDPLAALLFSCPDKLSISYYN